MTIEEAVGRKATRVFGEAGGQQVGDNAGRRGWTLPAVKPVFELLVISAA